MRFTALLACLFALALAGCLETSDTTKLEKDGSGTVSATYAVMVKPAEELIGQAWMIYGGGGELPDPLPNPLHPAWFVHDAKGLDGFEVVKAKEYDDPELGTRTTVVQGKFTSLEAAAKANAFFSGVTLSRVKKSAEVPNGGWKLSFQNVFAGDPLGMGMDASQMLPMFETYLKTLRMTRRITLPTKILDTNGKKSEDGKTVSWVVTYDRLVEGKDITATVVFEAAEGLELKPFTFSPNLRVLSKRAAEQPPIPKEDEGAEGDGEEKGGADGVAPKDDK